MPTAAGDADSPPSGSGIAGGYRTGSSLPCGARPVTRRA
jgi:hypothetical protein